jgi:hypothetical protein
LEVVVVETNCAEHRSIRRSLQASGDGMTAGFPALEQVRKGGLPPLSRRRGQAPLPDLFLLIVC